MKRAGSWTVVIVTMAVLGSGFAAAKARPFFKKRRARGARISRILPRRCQPVCEPCGPAITGTHCPTNVLLNHGTWATYFALHNTQTECSGAATMDADYPPTHPLGCDPGNPNGNCLTTATSNVIQVNNLEHGHIVDPDFLRDGIPPGTVFPPDRTNGVTFVEEGSILFYTGSFPNIRERFVEVLWVNVDHNQIAGIEESFQFGIGIEVERNGRQPNKAVGRIEQTGDNAYRLKELLRNRYYHVLMKSE